MPHLRENIVIGGFFPPLDLNVCLMRRARLIQSDYRLSFYRNYLIKGNSLVRYDDTVVINWVENHILTLDHDFIFNLFGFLSLKEFV